MFTLSLPWLTVALSENNLFITKTVLGSPNTLKYNTLGAKSFNQLFDLF